MRLRRGRATALTVALALALGAAACVDEPDVVTCENFDTYLSICYFSCVAGWDCRYAYRRTDADTQLTLDYCSDCLAEEADLECHDCVAPGGESCQGLLESSLGLVCEW